MSPYRKILKYIPTFDTEASFPELYLLLCVALNSLIIRMNSFLRRLKNCKTNLES